MRFKITLRVHKEVFGNQLPISYQYELSAWIYSVVAKSDNLYATWLHDNGFMEHKKGIFTENMFTIGDKKSKIQFQVVQIEMLPYVRSWIGREKRGGFWDGGENYQLKKYNYDI